MLCVLSALVRINRKKHKSYASALYAACEQACRRLAGPQVATGEVAATAGPTTQQLTAGELVAVAYRSSKKALLWDCLLAHEQATSEQI